MFYYKHYYIFQTVMFGNVHCNVIIWKLRHFPVRLFFFFYSNFLFLTTAAPLVLDAEAYLELPL